MGRVNTADLLGTVVGQSVNLTFEVTVTGGLGCDELLEISV
jgi:hypothetical protein